MATGKADGHLDKKALAGLLLRTGGRRLPGDPSDLRRWAPTKGDHGSVRLYSVANGGVFGTLSAVLTVYDDMEHRLIAARADPVPPEALLAGSSLLAAAGLPHDRPALVVALVGDFARLGQAYGASAYRVLHLDAGVAAAQLALVAQASGLRTEFASCWRDDLGSVLFLEEGREIVTALALISEVEDTHAVDC